MKNFKELARAYALKNALSYDGKAQESSVISSLFNEGLKKNDVKKIISDVKSIVREVNLLGFEEQKKEFEKLKNLVSERKVRIGLEELPNVSRKGVIMRFAPSASGPLHIGHALTSCLSYLYVKKYGGKFYFRIEDTNPENSYQNSYNLLIEDAKWLFQDNAIIIVQSERMELYYKYIGKLIRIGACYICTCLTGEFKEYVRKKKNCPCRKNNIKEHQKRWKKMLDKSGFNEGEAVLRFKSGMKNINPAKRDFPLARINLKKHPLQKNKYRVWPLMNLAVTVDDIETKATHVIRGKDHKDNAERQELIFKALKKKFPWTAFLGKIKFSDIELSTRKIREKIAKGDYSGWDDEKLPTLISLRSQGYKKEAFYKFAERIGLSKNDKVMDKKEYFRLLDYFNRG